MPNTITNWKARLTGLLFRLSPAIKNHVDRRRHHQTMQAFRAHYTALDSRVAREKGVMAFHRMLLITGLALYRALDDEIPDQRQRIDAIHDILWNGPMSKLVRVVAFFIRRSKDPFDRYLQILGPNNEWFFPCPPWEKERVEVQGGTGWHQTKCPHADFFTSEGVPALTRAYCDMDLRIAELLPDHIELRREHALCQGDGWCDFLYYRKTGSRPARAETPKQRHGRRAA